MDEPFQFHYVESSWTGESGGLQSVESQRDGHNGAAEYAHTYHQKQCVGYLNLDCHKPTV